jgi:hypothetical protein
MRLGTDALVITQRKGEKGSCSVGLLSQTFLKAVGAEVFLSLVFSNFIHF